MPFTMIIILMLAALLAAVAVFFSFEAFLDSDGLGVLSWLLALVFCIGLIVGGIVWLVHAHANEKLEWETFHNLVVDIQDGKDVQCIRLRGTSTIIFVNMNAKFSHIIKDGTLVRRYANKNWSCGVYSFCPLTQYELIDSKHKRYTEA